jgi:hypothetical protein
MIFQLPSGWRRKMSMPGSTDLTSPSGPPALSTSRCDKLATATVIAEGDLRAITFDRGELRQFFDKETEVAGLICRELANMIKVSNMLLAGADT